MFSTYKQGLAEPSLQQAVAVTSEAQLNPKFIHLVPLVLHPVRKVSQAASVLRQVGASLHLLTLQVLLSQIQVSPG